MNRTDFGIWVSKQINQTGLTWLQFEKTSGFNSDRLTRWVNGKCKPTLGNFIVFCESLAKHQPRTLTEIIVEGLTMLPEYQGAERRGHK